MSDDNLLLTRTYLLPGDVTNLYTWGCLQDRACRVDTENGPHYIVKAGAYYAIVNPATDTVETDSWYGLLGRYTAAASVTVLTYVTMTDR